MNIETLTNKKITGRYYIIMVNGGYFGGSSMRGAYLISDIAGAHVIESLRAAILWKKDIGTDAYICKVEHRDGLTYIQQKNKKLIY